MKINICKENLFRNLQHTYASQRYVLHSMNGYSDIGNRKRQEDSLIIDTHPSNENICLMGIADGMGGLKNGALASNIALRLLTTWFENLPTATLNNDIILSKYINRFLISADELIRAICSEGGTTLAFSIIREESTIYVNVGDSRIYSKANSSLQQLSSDQSLCWNLWETGTITEKNAIYFHKKNNLITSRLGCIKRKLEIEKKIIDNSQFDSIYIFSDGITDCLTDEQLRTIVNFPNCCAKTIVTSALENTLTQNYLNNEDFYNEVKGGKDNATAVMYCKKRRAKDEIQTMA